MKTSIKLISLLSISALTAVAAEEVVVAQRLNLLPLKILLPNAIFRLMWVRK